MSEEPYSESFQEDPEALPQEALAELVYGRIADDERLRGSLSDTGYGLLLDWCANRVVNVALETTDVSSDELTDAFRDAMQRLVAVAESGDPSPLEGLPSLVVEPACLEELIGVIQHEDDPDVRSERLAACLVEMSP